MVASIMKYFYLIVALFCMFTGIMAGFMQEVPLSVMIVFLGIFNLVLYVVFHRETLKKRTS